MGGGTTWTDQEWAGKAASPPAGSWPCVCVTGMRICGWKMVDKAGIVGNLDSRLRDSVIAELTLAT